MCVACWIECILNIIFVSVKMLSFVGKYVMIFMTLLVLRMFQLAIEIIYHMDYNNFVPQTNITLQRRPGYDSVFNASLINFNQNETCICPLIRNVNRNKYPQSPSLYVRRRWSFSGKQRRRPSSRRLSQSGGERHASIIQSTRPSTSLCVYVKVFRTR